MYYVYLNIIEQVVVIEKDGVLVAMRALPSQQTPNPGKEALMALPGNQGAFDAVYDLVAFVNVLPSVLAENARPRESASVLKSTKI